MGVLNALARHVRVRHAGLAAVALAFALVASPLGAQHQTESSLPPFPLVALAATGGSALGSAGGFALGYQLGIGGGDDPGLSGALVGAVVGSAAGTALALHFVDEDSFGAVGSAVTGILGGAVGAVLLASVADMDEVGVVLGYTLGQGLTAAALFDLLNSPLEN